MEIKIPYASNDKKTAYESAKTSIPVAVEKFGVKADVKFSESDYTIQAKGTGFDAKIQFQD